MASHGIRMQRFGPAEHPHAHKTCAPASRPVQSLAYESPAVPYPVAELGAHSGVTRLAKPCLRASDCVPSRREIGAGLESKLHSDMAPQESVCFVLVRPSILTHTRRALRGLARPRALPTNPLLCQRMEKVSRRPGLRPGTSTRTRKSSTATAFFPPLLAGEGQGGGSTMSPPQTTNNQQPTTNNQQPTTNN